MHFSEPEVWNMVSFIPDHANGSSARFFPLESADMHEAMCARHNTLCAKCNGIFKKTEIESHLQTAHMAVCFPSMSSSNC